MSHKKPPPLIAQRRRLPCPVCGEISYSQAGVHPQCAAKQADVLRMNRVRLERQITPPANLTVDIKPWQRFCPQCKVLTHVRKKVCSCGHSFAATSRPTAPESE